MNEPSGHRSRSLKNDLDSGALSNWNWDSGKSAESLDALRNACIKFSADTVDWYNRKKSGKQVLAKFLRMTAIVLGGVSALLLISSQQEKGPSAAYATGTMVVAGTLVALDRFFGFTNAWIRFIETANSIRVLQRNFLLDWESQEVAWAKEGPTEEQVKQALTLARGYVASVDAAVTDEIAEWAQQFRSSVTRNNNKMDELLKDGAPVANPAGANPAGADADGQNPTP